jgi:ribosomal protein S18 acetylase RimI-like enzyme
LAEGVRDIREANEGDIDGMSRVLDEIFAAKLRNTPGSRDFVRERYLAHPDRLACTLALDGPGLIAGFQSLKRAAAGNDYGVAAGWGIIGTHISPRAARRGVGAALFAASRQAAQAAGLTMIDATIGETNTAALAYYEAMGFCSYRTFEGCICKQYEVR